MKSYTHDTPTQKRKYSIPSKISASTYKAGFLSGFARTHSKSVAKTKSTIIGKADSNSIVALFISKFVANSNAELERAVSLIWTAVQLGEKVSIRQGYLQICRSSFILIF